MDVCLSYTDGEVTEQLARDVLGTSGREFQFDFMDALIDCDAKKSLQLIAQAMDLGRDPQVFAREYRSMPVRYCWPGFWETICASSPN